MFLTAALQHCSNFCFSTIICLKQLAISINTTIFAEKNPNMGNIKIIKGVFDTELKLLHAGVKAGFPSPAEDYLHETLDFNRDATLTS
jgi:hypothetical protein